MIEVGKLYEEAWYPTLIFFKDLPNSKELNKKLLKDIYKWKKEDEGIVRSNTTGWHSAVNMHEKKEFMPLVTELFKMQKEIYQKLNYSEETTPMMDNMWANVNYKYAYNKNHTHPGAQWSGVYYIKSPKKSGNIWFTDPRPQTSMETTAYQPDKKRPTSQLREVYYEPIEGRLIMFPGWLLHEVEMNQSDLKGEDGHRVSVSFNFKQAMDKTKVQRNRKGHTANAKTFDDYE